MEDETPPAANESLAAIWKDLGLPPRLAPTLRLEVGTLGDQAPRIGGVRVLTDYAATTPLEAHVVWGSGARLRVVLSFPLPGRVDLECPVDVRDLVVSATVRLSFRWTTALPCVGSIDVTLPEAPDIRFALTPLGGPIEVARLPLLGEIVRRAVDAGVRAGLVYPESVTIPFYDVPLRPPVGLVHLVVRSACGVRSPIWLDSPDPYVELAVGLPGRWAGLGRWRAMGRTSTQPSTERPQWGEDGRGEDFYLVVRDQDQEEIKVRLLSATFGYQEDPTVLEAAIPLSEHPLVSKPGQWHEELLGPSSTWVMRARGVRDDAGKSSRSAAASRREGEVGISGRNSRVDSVAAGPAGVKILDRRAARTLRRRASVRVLEIGETAAVAAEDQEWLDAQGWTPADRQGKTYVDGPADAPHNLQRFHSVRDRTVRHSAGFDMAGKGGVAGAKSLVAAKPLGGRGCVPCMSADKEELGLSIRFRYLPLVSAEVAQQRAKEAAAQRKKADEASRRAAEAERAARRAARAGHVATLGLASGRGLHPPSAKMGAGTLSFLAVDKGQDPENDRQSAVFDTANPALMATTSTAALPAGPSTSAPGQPAASCLGPRRGTGSMPAEWRAQSVSQGEGGKWLHRLGRGLHRGGNSRRHRKEQRSKRGPSASSELSSSTETDLEDADEDDVAGHDDDVGVVSITVVRCEGLESPGLDPCVHLAMVEPPRGASKGTTRRTRTHTEIATQNPDYNEDFEFAHVPRHSMIQLEVWDEALSLVNRVSRLLRFQSPGRRRLGGLSLSVYNVARAGGHIRADYPLEGATRGRLTLDIKWLRIIVDNKAVQGARTVVMGFSTAQEIAEGQVHIKSPRRRSVLET